MRYVEVRSVGGEDRKKYINTYQSKELALKMILEKQ